MTSSLVIIAMVAGLGWYFSTKRGNPMRSNVNGAIYCLGATAVLLGFAIYSIVVTASSNGEGGSAGYAVAVLTVPVAAAFAAGGWVFARRAKSARHQRPDDSPDSMGGSDG
ncbi:hypothetical protein AB2L28_08385 [Kineococcus sp. TBRC 1896]|uniref:Integral membrane protein n=1 Tax=Kineococcus mangrovi TaxID=1660183 RepID=A0ABV4I171_9ACTN